MDDSFHAIVAALPREGVVIGSSRETRPIHGHRYGSGPFRISLIAGCHADEPVGPRFLHHLSGYLGGLDESHPFIRDFEWWIVPHVNPDGEVRNRAWHDDADAVFDPGLYAQHVVRELPGDDIEFGFPRTTDDTDARPENRAVAEWWRTAAGPFALHGSLHGMAVAAGPWFLIDRAWARRSEEWQRRCALRVAELGYVLHDVERHGEKGFHRIAPGFCTRPDSESMRRYFLERDDRSTAQLFRPSSMETIRGLGGDPLTLVTEMPLFIGESMGADLVPMPVRDQMELQWTCITAAIETVRQRSP